MSVIILNSTQKVSFFTQKLGGCFQIGWEMQR